jgi:hypothetical protein
MRRTLIIAALAALAAFGGFCLASASAFASLQFNVWQKSDERFRLGYVIGYLDAVALMQRKDVRVQVPLTGGKNFDHWMKGLEAFYADPANQTRSVPEAIYEIGSKARDDMLRNWGLRRMGKPVPTPSAEP